MKKLLLALYIVLAPVTALAQSTQAAQHLGENNIAVGSVTSSYAAILTNTQPLRFFELVNTADCNLFLSWDGTTDHYYIPAGTSLTLNFADLGMHLSGDAEIKHDGSACTSGYISANGAYKLNN